MTQIHWTKFGPIIFISNFFVKQKHMTEFKRVVLTPSFINLLLKAVSEQSLSAPNHGYAKGNPLHEHPCK